MDEQSLKQIVALTSHLHAGEANIPSPQQLSRLSSDPTPAHHCTSTGSTILSLALTRHPTHFGQKMPGSCIVDVS